MTETFSRPWKWLFTLMATYFIYVLGMMFLPFSAIKNTALLITVQALAYCFFLFILSQALKRLGFSLIRLINPDGIFDLKKFFKPFAIYLASLAIFSLFRYLLCPECYTLVQPYRFFTWMLPATLFFTPVQVLFEETIFRSYASRFFQDNIPNETNKKVLLYSIVTGLLFAIMHVKNPEFNWREFTFVFKDFILFFHTFSFYFIFGFYLMFISLKLGSFEVALALHLANNFFIDFFVGYKDAASLKMPIFFYNGDIHFLLISELVFCLASVTFFFYKDYLKQKIKAGVNVKITKKFKKE